MNINCNLCYRLQIHREGKNPFFIKEFPNCVWFLGDHQYYPGYSILVLKNHISHLHELETSEFNELNSRLVLVANVLKKSFNPWRFNYQCYSNRDEHISWHIVPRYQSDPLHLKPPGADGVSFENEKISIERAAAIARECQLAFENFILGK